MTRKSANVQSCCLTPNFHRHPAVSRRQEFKKRGKHLALGSAFPKVDGHAFRNAFFKPSREPLPQSRFLLSRESQESHSEAAALVTPANIQLRRELAWLTRQGKLNQRLLFCLEWMRGLQPHPTLADVHGLGFNFP